MKKSLLSRRTCLLLASILGVITTANTVTAQSTVAGPGTQPETVSKSEETFLAGTFSGDDIELKLDSKGRFVLSGGVVEKTLHGSWTLEKAGLHTLLRLSVDKKGEDDWQFGVRSKNTLQSVDGGKLKLLDRPLNIKEDAGVLTRIK